jgi:hypothetical protein
LDSSSGSSISATWNKAGVNNLGDATIYYSYYIGNTRSVDDAHYIGETTDLNAGVTE